MTISDKRRFVKKTAGLSPGGDKKIPSIVKIVTTVPAIIVCRFFGNHKDSNITAEYGTAAAIPNGVDRSKRNIPTARKILK